MSYSAAQHGFRMNGFNSHEDGHSPQGKIEPSDDHIEDIPNMMEANGYGDMQTGHVIKDEPIEDISVMPPDDTMYGSTFHSKHICQVCGDRASGKHYGLYSCEGCKGFFKRTVRKELTYSCRDNKACTIDKRQRNRCQYCRYQKCLRMGMKREAVQGETDNVPRAIPAPEREPASPVSLGNPFEEFSVELINEAEAEFDRIFDCPELLGNSPQNDEKQSDRLLASIVAWVKVIPKFSRLNREDQICLLRAAWNEVLIADIAHRSIDYDDVLLIGKNESMTREQANTTHVEIIFDRVMTELVQKMREMNLDRTELGCLKAIVLYNPDIKQLDDARQIEELREKVYASLEAYAKQKYPDQPGRFAKLLLRLPALRSIGLKCLESMFLFKTVGGPPHNNVIRNFI